MSEINSFLHAGSCGGMLERTTPPEQKDYASPALQEYLASSIPLSQPKSILFPQTSNGLLTDACHGFVSRASEALQHPVETLGMLTSSAAIGGGLSFVAKNPELWGGRIGMIGRLAPKVMIPLLVIDLAHRIHTAAHSESPGSVVGATIFDYGLYGLAGSAGYRAANVPGKIQTLLGPRPLTELPNGVKYQLRGDEVIVSSTEKLTGPAFQVKLANGTGFKVPSYVNQKVYKGTIEPMPSKLNDGSKVKYSPDHMAVTSSDGSVAKRFLNGTIEKIDKGVSVKTYTDGTKATTHLNGDVVTINGTFGGRLGEKSLLTSKGVKITELIDGDVIADYPNRWHLSFSKSGAQVQDNGRYKFLISPEGEITCLHKLGRRWAGRTLEYDLGKLAPGQESITVRNATLPIFQKPKPIDEVAGRFTDLNLGWRTEKSL